MTTEYHTKFLERIQRTPTIISYRFEVPEGFVFDAGQYMLVYLGDKLMHPLSLSNAPQEAKVIEFTKRMTGSPFCKRLEALERGESIKIKGPIGKFCQSDSNETLVMIAGGIGITPIMSILTNLERKEENPGKVILIYGNFNKENIAFKEELENLKLPDYRLVHVLSDTTGMEDRAYQGFITASIIAKEVPLCDNAQYMVSGPPAMVEAMKQALATIDVAEEKIRTDIFFGFE